MPVPSSLPPPPSGHQPYFVGDHPALDLLNTVARPEGVTVDFWQSDADVERWLEQAGYGAGASGGTARYARGELLAEARRLREAVRALVEQRKAGRRGDPAVLNEFLREASSYAQLAWARGAAPHLVWTYASTAPRARLAPLAEQAAELLVEGDFALVRRCEHPDCILWFYDRTKSHKRRWCSMAVCGNRHKVAEFRRRQQA
ncbi:CGNR zinc finger domain-containing protein [Solimonas flava]|uniref:CGNR zinc finger domain-containing protein n=1 Tax=Solimonas flava TaxID=415849 RepID=UPI00041B13FE|nr:ABATE domain-containing protein [Solimonas flava]